MSKLTLDAKTVEAVLAFRDDRKWAPFHNPKDLAMSVSIEAGELLECFQWTGADTEAADDPVHVKEEMADVLIYTLYLADRLGIDLDAAVREKLIKNAEKYPLINAK